MWRATAILIIIIIIIIITMFRLVTIWRLRLCESQPFSASHLPSVHGVKMFGPVSQVLVVPFHLTFQEDLSVWVLLALLTLTVTFRYAVAQALAPIRLF